MTNPFNNDPQNQGPQDPYGNNSYGSYPTGDSTQHNAYGAFPSSEANNFNEAGLHGRAANIPGVGSRFLSFLIDTIIGIIISAISTVIFAGGAISDFANDFSDYLEATETNPDAPVPSLDYGPLLLSSLVALVLYMLYRGLMESKNGGTLGRMVTGTKVINIETKGNVTLGAALLRGAWVVALALLTAVPGIGGIIALVLYIVLAVQIGRNPAGQHSFDTWSKSQVVYKN